MWQKVRISVTKNRVSLLAKKKEGFWEESSDQHKWWFGFYARKDLCLTECKLSSKSFVLVYMNKNNWGLTKAPTHTPSLHTLLLSVAEADKVMGPLSSAPSLPLWSLNQRLAKPSLMAMHANMSLVTMSLVYQSTRSGTFTWSCLILGTSQYSTVIHRVGWFHIL